MKEGTTTDIVEFEYLSLLPRIYSWATDETSYGHVFDCHRKKIA